MVGERAESQLAADTHPTAPTQPPQKVLTRVEIETDSVCAGRQFSISINQ
jgi:hypothetical protein